MDINKAIRKQNKSYKKFVLSMSLIFFILPAVLLLSKRVNIFFISYLIVIEVLILIVTLVSINNERLKFHTKPNRLIIKSGIFREEFNIACDKIALVHVDNKDSAMQLTLLSVSKFRNKRIRPVDSLFLKKNPVVAHHYYRIKKLHPEENYYYIVLNKGGFYKYKLLDTIFKNCVYAFYTDECVERIKEYRNQE